MGGQEFPPVTVGVISSDLSRFSWFMQSLRGLWLPPGSQVVFSIGLWIPEALNSLIEEMRPTDAAFMFLPDDHTFACDLVYKLLAHELPLVMPICNLRRPPLYSPSIFHDYGGDDFRSYAWDELKGQRGVIPVDSAGAACALIRRDVIEAIGQPFFEHLPGSRTSPKEDLYTMRKCRLAGFQPYVDLSTTIGHCFVAVGEPVQLDSGDWGVRIWSHETIGVIIPAVPKPAPEATPPIPYHAYT